MKPQAKKTQQNGKQSPKNINKGAKRLMGNTEGSPKNFVKVNANKIIESKKMENKGKQFDENIKQGKKAQNGKQNSANLNSPKKGAKRPMVGTEGPPKKFVKINENKKVKATTENEECGCMLKNVTVHKDHENYLSYLEDLEALHKKYNLYSSDTRNGINLRVLEFGHYEAPLTKNEIDTIKKTTKATDIQNSCKTNTELKGRLQLIFSNSELACKLYEGGQINMCGKNFKFTYQQSKMFSKAPKGKKSKKDASATKPIPTKKAADTNVEEETDDDDDDDMAEDEVEEEEDDDLDEDDESDDDEDDSDDE